MLNVENFKELIKDSILEDIIEISEVEDCSDEEELKENIEELINEQSIFYYGSAMEYLSENDPSLSVSLNLAHDMGFTLEKLNSETLATLLYQDDLRGQLNELDFSECFNEE